MFRRSTKITSLIVAAASVATMVPAMAATKSLEEKDGTVYKAIAYKDGKFYVDGEVKDDDSAAYYLENGKYTELDDVDNGETVDLYGDKYVNISDGDAYLDLETGKVNDEDDLVDDNADDAKTAVEKKIKKDGPGRYTLNSDGKPELLAPHTITTPYAEDWYSYNIDGYNVYSDVKGNYIDADYDLGKIKLVITENNSAENEEKGLMPVTTDSSVSFGKTEAITLENTKDIAKTSDKNYGFKAKYVKDPEIIGQDKDYIYRLAYIGIDLYEADARGKFGETALVSNLQKTSNLSFGGVNDVVRVTTGDAITVLQKISKAQNSDEVDDAKYPKSTQTYFFNEYKDFYAKKKKDYKDRFAGAREELTGKKDGWSIYNGKVLNYRYDGSNFKAQVFTLKDKAGFYYLDKGDSDFDVDDDEFAVTTAADGTIWVLDNGKIKKYQGDGFETVYKCDGAMNAISVYDENNIIVWNEDEDEYAIIGGDSTTKEEDTAEDTTTSAAAGWVQDATTGAWSYVKADGTKAIGWFQSPTSGLWYYMDANGIMQANGWIQDGGYWYFLDATGAMKTGWVYTGGAWYFLKPTAGNMGAMQTGWIQTGGKWYYCNASGAMLSNTTVGGYVLGADGAWIK